MKMMNEMMNDKNLMGQLKMSYKNIKRMYVSNMILMCEKVMGDEICHGVKLMGVNRRKDLVSTRMR